MARETKVGLLVGLGVILLVGIVVSDHLSVVQRQAPADLSNFPPQALNSVSVSNDQLPAGPSEGVVLPPTGFGPQTASAPPAAPLPPAPQNAIPLPGEARPTVQAPTLPQLQRPADIDLPGATALAPTPDAGLYVVKAGDTLSGIASQKLGSATKWKDLLAANKDQLKRPEDLQIGMKLKVPASATPVVANAGTVSNPAQTSGPLQPNVQVAAVNHAAPNAYTVAKGDTLSSIAAKTMGSATKWKALMTANKDKLKRPEDLRIGQVITVPALASR